MRLSYVFILILSLLIACGEEESGKIDGTIDSSTIDADSATCESMCDCRVSTCGETDRAGCVADCLKLAPSIQSCRLEHCGFAQTQSAPVHCPHTLGQDNTCVGAVGDDHAHGSSHDHSQHNH